MLVGGANCLFHPPPLSLSLPNIAPLAPHLDFTFIYLFIGSLWLFPTIIPTMLHAFVAWGFFNLLMGFFPPLLCFCSYFSLVKDAQTTELSSCDSWGFSVSCTCAHPVLKNNTCLCFCNYRHFFLYSLSSPSVSCFLFPASFSLIVAYLRYVLRLIMWCEPF